MKTACCQGLDVVIGAVSKKYLVMHIDDPAGLVAKEKGSGTAWLTSTLVPDFVENKIYDEVTKQLKDQFRAKGSSVSVEVTQVPPKGGPTTNDLLTGIAVGGVLAGIGYLLFKFLKRRS